MKKIFLILSVLLLTFTLIGCEKVSPFEPGVTVNSSLKPSFYYIGNGFIIDNLSYICDRKTNNVYIYLAVGNRGAMSAYYDETGKIAKCNEVK